MADIEPPTKRICLVAPKGSVSNNPFRMLPSEVLSNIKAMKSDKHPPTPTALLIKDLAFDYVTWYLSGGDVDVLEVSVHQSAAGVTLGTEDEEGPVDRLHFCNACTFRDLPDFELGVVRTPTWIRLRQYHSYEDALDYMLTIASDHGITDWNQI